MIKRKKKMFNDVKSLMCVRCCNFVTFMYLYVPIAIKLSWILFSRIRKLRWRKKKVSHTHTYTLYTFKYIHSAQTKHTKTHAHTHFHPWHTGEQVYTCMSGECCCYVAHSSLCLFCCWRKTNVCNQCWAALVLQLGQSLPARLQPALI